MGHSIHKHMNSFKAKNLLSEMPIDNRASALEMNKAAAYMSEEDDKKKKKKLNKYQEAYANKTDMVPNPNKGNKFYTNPSTGLRLKLDKQGSEGDEVPQIVLDNLKERTSGNK